MFDFSFIQTCMVITATAILLGRHETLTASKYIGKTCGRVIGTMKGYRAKYENSVKDSNTDLMDLQTNVRKELNELSTVAHDLNMIGSTNVMSSRMSMGATNSMINRQNTNVSYSNSNSQPPVTGLTSTPISHTINTNPTTPNPSRNHEQMTLKLTKLILADEELKKMNGNASKIDEYGSGSGSDIISTCISESILNESYRIATKK